MKYVREWDGAGVDADNRQPANAKITPKEIFTRYVGDQWPSTQI